MAKEYSVYELNRIQQYIMQMRPVLKKEALFSDGTKDYRNPTEPEAGEKVTIRFRTGVVKGSRHVPDPCGSFLQWWSG